MTISGLLAALLLAAPASAQTRVAAPVSPVTGIVPLQIGAAPAPIFSMAPSLSPAASLTPALALIAPVPALAPRASAASVPLPVKIAALNAGAKKISAALSEKTASANGAHGSGRDLEALLTGAALSAPSAPESFAASPEELAFAAAVSPALAARADDLAASKGLKAARMSGAEFLTVLDEARGAGPAAPTPAAAAAAREIESALIRVARALIPAEQPLSGSIRRALAVWQVFNQEMAVAAEKGSLEAVAADAALFASQVENSVEPKTDPAPLQPHDQLKANDHPEDPDGYAAVGVPGSIFGWKPIEESPNHGLPPLDALIRRVLSDKKGAYAKGFELAGAANREDARVYFYGERHTDGALIAANMKRLVEDARIGKPLIVLVEGYTGWSLRGWPAVKYLADRGLDPDALAGKSIPSGDVEVRGWDTAANYDASKHPLLQHHMDRLALNHLAHGEARGWRYYRDFARAALVAWRGFQELWRLAIVARNADLDRAVAKAADDADASGATVHVIAGTDHLMQNPRLTGLPLIGRPTVRRSLHDALAGRPYWASQPPNTQD